jgi:molybdopterin-guanine dinucleotide biosynthesis protein A
MGTDKAFVELDGRTLLSRALDLARSVTRDVHIVGDPAKFSPFAPTIEDLFPDCGPLGGIHAALRSSHTDLNLILAVDIPFVSPPLLQFVIMRARNSAPAIVTLAQADGRSQPLCAVYRKPFADAAEQSLCAGHNKIDKLFEATATQVISEEELESAGFPMNMFRNLNTQKELADARGKDDDSEARS